jgi:hypothetical protein
VPADKTIPDVTTHASLTRTFAPENAVRRGAETPERRVQVALGCMTTNTPPDNKPSGTTEPTARESVLSWAEQQSRIRARATRALVSIRQTHLSFYQ